MAMTRLAQNTPLRLKAYYDCNPPSELHWTYRVFMNKLDPESRVALRDRDQYAAMLLNPAGNKENLPKDYLEELQLLPERMRRRFWLGQFSDATDNALWTYEVLDRARKLEGDLPDMQRILIAVDPSGCAGEEDTRSDEVGIVVCGLGSDGRGYLLEDLSGRMGPPEWGHAVVQAFDRHGADAVVAETNFGGAMVAEVIRAAQDPKGRRIPFREVHASRGKVVRAEPIATLYEQGKISHVGYFDDLENQLCAMSTAGYAGTRSPDRADALVWCFSEMFPGLTRRESKQAPQRSIYANRGYQHMKGHAQGRPTLP
jgi:predicted phage terminase large subunit-like protein